MKRPLLSILLPSVVCLVPALVACGGPSSKTAADVDDDSTSKSAGDKTPPADDAGTAAATASAGSTAGAPGSADDSTGPKKDECTVFDEPNLEGVLLKSACEAPNPTGQPPDTSKTLVVKVTASPNVVAPGGHADVLVSYTNKSAAPIPLYFTIDPMPRFEIETYNVKGNRVDLPKNSPPPLPAGVAPREPGEAKTARILLAANGTARMPLSWDAVKMRWAPEKLKGTPPEKGYPRAPAGPLLKGKYSVKVVTPLTYVFEGIDHEVSAPRVDVVVKK
ncbi:MAG: hypothetical protein ACLQVI_21925 [Polyangiaceae bacterium]|jgi:hypothetical protein